MTKQDATKALRAAQAKMNLATRNRQHAAMKMLAEECLRLYGLLDALDAAEEKSE